NSLGGWIRIAWPSLQPEDSRVVFEITQQQATHLAEPGQRSAEQCGAIPRSNQCQAIAKNRKRPLECARPEVDGVPVDRDLQRQKEFLSIACDDGHFTSLVSRRHIRCAR